MPLQSSSLTTTLYFLIFLFVIFLILNHSLALSELSNDIAVNCGSSSIFNGNDGQKWIGDIGSKLLVTSQNSEAKSIRTKLTHLPDIIPYTTARISYKQFSYEIEVGAGQKFIRLYFYPSMYKGFERSNDLFTVKAGPFTLLSNFSASLTVDALGVKYLMKEFCINIEENKLLIITFSPSISGAKGKAYAFVNGIEIISMPTGLYYTPMGEPAMYVVGKKHQLLVDESIALEMVYRLNMGGSSISSVEDTGLFREWSDDSNFFVNSDVRPVSTSNRIKYKSTASYSAPQKVYQTSWAKVLTEKVETVDNFTWKLPLDLGFRYLIRFHFYELGYEIQESSRLRFSILINDQVAEANADLITWSGGNGIALFKDYVAEMGGDRTEGKRDLLISLIPKWSNNGEWWTESTDTVLKGLEVFKLSNPDNNLAGVNPMPMSQALSSSIPRKYIYANGGNSIATVTIILISLVCIILYQLRIFREQYSDNKILISQSEGVSRRFSLAEVQTATNNFDELLIIGRGGFGSVYKGEIDCGVTTVALKRLNSTSKQGSDEFWTEIDLLSKLRHTHLVSLIGYCNEGGEMVLVYEYMEHGTLADHLYKISCNTSFHLSWEQKLKICIGAARGLDYLHTGTRHGIIHRDVKTTNILLDNELVAKISDFGLCKVGPTSHSRSHVSTLVKGSFGYFDPGYFLSGRLTKKTDVYAFGVVLLEVLCGRPAVDISLSEDRHSLALWGKHCIKEEKFDELIGPSLRDQISYPCLKVFTEVAYKCLDNRPKGRPTMSDVVVSLEGALISQNHNEEIVSEQNEEEGVKNEESDDYCSDGNDYCSDGRLSEFLTNESLEDYLFGRISQNHNGEIVSEQNEEEGDKNDESDSCHLFGTVKLNGSPQQGPIPSPTTPVQDGENMLQDKKRSKGKLNKAFQWNFLGLFNKRASDSTSNDPPFKYKLLPNGSLEDYLFGSGGSQPLQWASRIKIAIDVAADLFFLHNEQVIHRDVKPSNILLDVEFNAKLSDCEFARAGPSDNSTHMSTIARVMGTKGYAAPEYVATGRLTAKCDVYSFGVVMVELLTGRRVDHTETGAIQILVKIMDTQLTNKGKLVKIMDTQLEGQYPHNEAFGVTTLALQCLNTSPQLRPQMLDVLVSLELLQGWDQKTVFEIIQRFNDETRLRRTARVSRPNTRLRDFAPK